MFSWLQELFEKDWTNVSIRPAYDKKLIRWEIAHDQYGIPIRYRRDFVDGFAVTLVEVPRRYIPRIRELELIQ